MSKNNPKVLVVATSRKTRGGITAVIKAHETGEQWKKYHCKWIETHRDGNTIIKLWYLVFSLINFVFFLPFYDIVHIHFSTTVSAKRKYVFFKTAKLYHKKIIIHLHCGDQLDAIWSPIYYKMFTHADIALVLSNVIRLKIETYIGHKNKLTVLYNPCPVIKQIDRKKHYILFAGTLILNKGYADLIKAFAIIVKQFPGWKLVFAGNREIEQAKLLVKELEIESQVVFLGWISGDKKNQTFKEASIFCLPSYAEGFPMAVLDAWAYGLPVIITPVGGLSDVVKDNVNALLFNPGDIEALSTQITKMISDEKLRKNIEKESLKLASGIFNPDAINKQLERIYENLLKDK
jgi:glycosyltransferase involved in cell wall biosynthesis